MSLGYKEMDQRYPFQAGATADMPKHLVLQYPPSWLRCQQMLSSHNYELLLVYLTLLLLCWESAPENGTCAIYRI